MTRRPRIVAAILGALHLGVALLALVPAPHSGGDNAVYLSLARSILAGGYRDLFDPAQPPHAHFPPGWPALLAPALALGVKPWVGVKYLTVLLSGVAVALTYLRVRMWRRPRLALWAAATMAVTPGVLALSHSELSEVPFTAVTLFAMIAWERSRARGWGWTVAAAAATSAAYLIRSAGLPLLVASAGWLAWRRRWRALAVHALLTLPAFVAWGAWTRQHRGGYVGQFWEVDPYAPDRGLAGAAELAARMVDNAGLYGWTYLPRFLGSDETGVARAAALLLLALAVYGWARRARRPGVAELFTPLYVGMVLLWPAPWSGERFILPLFPLLLAYAAAGATWLAGRRRWAAPALAGALALVILPGAAGAVLYGSDCRAEYAAGDRFACMPGPWKDFFGVAAVASRALPRGSAVLSRKPALFFVESGVPGRTYPLDRSPDALLRAARAAGARYVVLDALDPMAEQYLTPAIVRRPAAFCVMHSLPSGGAVLLGIVAGAERIPDQRADPGAADTTVGFKRCPAEFWRSGAAMRELGPA